MRRSVTMKRTIQPVLPASRSMRISSKRPVFHSAMKSRCSDSSSYLSPFLVKIRARRVSWGTRRAPRNSISFDGVVNRAVWIRLRFRLGSLRLRRLLLRRDGNGFERIGFFLLRRLILFLLRRLLSGLGWRLRLLRLLCE